MSNRRQLVLEQLNPKKDTGMLDPRVFKGGNTLYVEMDLKTALWRFRMEHGLVPVPLRDKFTDLNAAIKQATAYFTAKCIKIKEVI